MRILIDIGHPAHVHLFRHFANIMIQKGHFIIFTATDKEHELYLLETFKFQFVSLGKRFKSLPGKIWGLVIFDLKLYNVAKKYKPDIFLSHGSMYAAQVAWLMKKPHIALEDTGNKEQTMLYSPFTKAILTPKTLEASYGLKQIKYNGYHELCYLHPNYFIPDQKIKQLLGLNMDERFALLRFISWDASHDRGQSGISNKIKLDLIEYLSERMHVFISSEKELDYKLKKYKIEIAPEKMHDVLAAADIFIGEGATMASEAGILGTPSIYINTLAACNNLEQENFGTVYNYHTGEKLIAKVEEILNISDYKELWFQKSRVFVNSKVDVTRMLVWFIENYPESMNSVQQNPKLLDEF